jgi:hypothetical protein
MNNKKFKSIDNNNNNKSLKRDSFSDRICDDLCEVLLSYLSFEDKIRFECVSKQFQRCVYNKQNILEVNDYMIEEKNKLNKLLIRLKANKSFNYKAFESVLKKSKFINEVIISCSFNMNHFNTEELMESIVKNCNNLKSIEFKFSKISVELVEKFGLKFGQKLCEIKFIGPHKRDDINKYKKLLRLCPNLISFGDRYYTNLAFFVDKNELLVPKLTKILTGVHSENIELFETFAKNYGNSLKNISIRADRRSKPNKTNVLMKNIIYLKNLNRLELWLKFGGNPNKGFIENLKAIAIHCNQLKKLKFNVSRTNPSLDKQIFNCLALFKNLNVLELNLDNNYEEIIEISCESLKDLKLLTHLKLEKPQKNDFFFEDIDKHLPQLKHLDIIVGNNKTTDKAMNSLSKLSKLQSITIECPDFVPQYEVTEEDNSADMLPFITDIGLLDVINNCPEIQLFSETDRILRAKQSMP